MSHPEDGLVRRAYAIAEAAHRGQRRKDGRVFIDHPVRVARLLPGRGYDEEVLAAGLRTTWSRTRRSPSVSCVSASGRAWPSSCRA